MSTDTLPRTPRPEQLGLPEEAPENTRLVEALLDNLPAWTVIAAAIAFLYLVWATLEILSRYVGGIPKLAP